MATSPAQDGKPLCVVTTTHRPMSSPLTEYEQQRQARIAENEQKLEALGLSAGTEFKTQAGKRSDKQPAPTKSSRSAAQQPTIREFHPRIAKVKRPGDIGMDMTTRGVDRKARLIASAL